MESIKIRRNYMIPEDVEKALGLVSVEKGVDRSSLVTEALRLHLPALSKLPPVQAIAAHSLAS